MPALRLEPMSAGILRRQVTKGSYSAVILRVIRGHVLGDRESEFVAICRRQAAGSGRAPGLVGFLPGYRRVEGADRFLLASTWRSEEDMRRTAGETAHPNAVDNLRGVAEIDTVDVYELREPVYEGLLDTPGAVLRVTLATVREGRLEQMLREGAVRLRQLVDENLLLAWMVGVREVGSRLELVAISAWPSPLVIEALNEPGQLMAMFAASNNLVTDVQIEHFQAIELQLPDEMSDISTRRVVAARFGSLGEAHAARDALLAIITPAADPGEAPVIVAPLGTASRTAEASDQLLVARVEVVEYGRVERLIADHGGQLLLAENERPAP